MLKTEIRAKYKELRKQIPLGSLQIDSEKISNLVFQNFNLQEKTISLFLPIEKQNEINTYIIWEKAKALNAKIAIPKANLTTNELKHHLFDQINQLELSVLGIPEPKNGKIIAADRFEYVFVPLLAFDKKGHRVGYGKGFYDRFLNKCAKNCVFIGLSFFDTIEEISDVLPTDMKLHACVTPEKVIYFPK